MALTKVTNDLQDALAASQPSITSVGTLTGLTVGGNLSVVSSDSYAIFKMRTDANDDGSNDDGIIQITNGSSDVVKAELRWDESTNTVELGHGDNQGHLVIDSSGRVTMPSQPAFQVKKNAIQTDIAVGAAVTVTWQTEIFDQGANFASNTFTAPVTGKYQLNAHLLLDNIDSGADYYQLILNTSNSLYYDTMDPFIGGADYSYQTVNHSVLADMDAGDTAIVTIVQGGGTSQSDLNATTCVFSGYLVA